MISDQHAACSLSMELPNQWDKASHNGTDCFYRGDQRQAKSLLLWLAQNAELPEPSEIGDFLRATPSHFATVVQSDRFVFAAVDTIRSTPLFYAESEGTHSELLISPMPRDLLGKFRNENIDQQKLTLFAMAGFVPGSGTIYQGLHQLRPGELLFHDRQTGQTQTHRYFRYLPTEPKAPHTQAEYQKTLGEVLDRVFQRVIERLDGRPVVVPLSGGLDSRIVLAKLHELGHRNLTTISYGAAGNSQVIRGEIISAQLGVPWQFIESTPKTARAHFEAPARAEFWKYADGLASLPTMQDFEPFFEMRERGLLPDDTVVINGQSGDFLTGGHIRPELISPTATADDFVRSVTMKHFRVFPKLVTESAISMVSHVLHQEFPEAFCDNPDPGMLASAYECCEWQERQCKFVINGERVYEFLGLGWELPLWDLELIQFFAKVPLDLRRNRRLFRDYLTAYDYQGLFTTEYPKEPGYAGLTGTSLSRLYGILRKMNFDAHPLLSWMNYQYGHYRSYYTMFDYDYFRANIPIDEYPLPPQGRWVVALMIKTWLKENGLLDQVPLET